MIDDMIDDIDRNLEIPSKLLRNSWKSVHNLLKMGFVGRIEPVLLISQGDKTPYIQ